MSSGWTEKLVEIETGVRIVVCKNREGLFSCCRKNWYPTMAEAYENAKREGALLFEEGNKNSDQFAAWALALFLELKELDPGASVKITRFGNEFVTTRERAVLPPLPVSELRDIDLKVQEES